MKLELEIGTNELGHDLIEQFFIWKLNDVISSIEDWDGYIHPSDKKTNKKIVKACKTILEYYGESD